MSLPNLLLKCQAHVIVTEQIRREMHSEALHAFYTFKEGSPLKDYIQKKRHTLIDCYTLVEILTILKEIIRDEGMYDRRNPALILCDNDLEKALNMKALHITEVREQVSSQLLRLPESVQHVLRPPALQTSSPVDPPLADSTPSR